MTRGSPTLLTYADVAGLLSCSPSTVKRLWKKGLLAEPQEYDGLGLRFWAEDIYEYIYAQRSKQRKPKQN